MFLRKLRRLVVNTTGEETNVTYNCKNCNVFVRIHLTTDEFDKLKSGQPFNVVFAGERKKLLDHFKKGLCEKHGYH